MHAAFVLQLGINFFALNRGDNFLYAADGSRRAFHNFDFPALGFGVTRVHAEKFAGEEPASSPPVPARISRMTFLSSLGSLGHKQKFQFAFDFFLANGELSSSSCAMCRISASSDSTIIWRAPARSFSICLNSRFFLDDFLEVGVLLGEFLEARGVVDRFRGWRVAGHFLVTDFELVEFFGKCENGHWEFLLSWDLSHWRGVTGKVIGDR